MDKARVLCCDPHRTAARGYLARLCLGCLSWLEQELGRGTDSTIRQASQEESKGFLRGALPGPAPMTLRDLWGSSCQCSWQSLQD